MDNILIPGVKIELSEITENSNRVDVYLSQICDIEEDDKRLSIAMPIKEGRLIPLSVGMKLNCYFFTKAGMFQSIVAITDRYRTDNLYFLVIELKTPLKKEQRRQFFRFETSMDVRYAPVDEDAIDIIETLKSIPDDLFSDKLLKGTTLDISGGGIKFSGIQLERCSKVYIEVDYKLADKTRRFRAIGNVISSEHPASKPGIWHNRVNYEIVRTEDREGLIRYIFEEERRARRNERRE